MDNNELEHYGMPRRSGRYPWGSGKDPRQTGGKTTSKKEQKEQKKQAKSFKSRPSGKIPEELLDSTSTVATAVVAKHDTEINKIQSNLNKTIERKLRKLRKMSPAQADEFMKNLEQIKAGNKAIEERVKLLSSIKMSKAQALQAQLKAVDSLINTSKAGVGLVGSAVKTKQTIDSIMSKAGNSNTKTKQISTGVDEALEVIKSIGKISANVQEMNRRAMKKETERVKVKEIPEKKMNQLAKSYRKVTGVSKTEANIQIKNMAKNATSFIDLSSKVAREILKDREEKEKLEKKKK